MPSNEDILAHHSKWCGCEECRPSAEWPKTISNAYHDARNVVSVDAFSIEVVPADLARELYEALKKPHKNGWDRRAPALARYEREVGR